MSLIHVINNNKKKKLASGIYKLNTTLWIKRYEFKSAHFIKNKNSLKKIHIILHRSYNAWSFKDTVYTVGKQIHHTDILSLDIFEIKNKHYILDYLWSFDKTRPPAPSPVVPRIFCTNNFTSTVQ